MAFAPPPLTIEQGKKYEHHVANTTRALAPGSFTILARVSLSKLVVMLPQTTCARGLYVEPDLFSQDRTQFFVGSSVPSPSHLYTSPFSSAWRVGTDIFPELIRNVFTAETGFVEVYRYPLKVHHDAISKPSTPLHRHTLISMLGDITHPPRSSARTTDPRRLDGVALFHAQSLLICSVPVRRA
ncbi:hypothetical protein EI94DRAFT_1806815 [Lactarius quietus]|nr:hypothetical protein EI94DRAFT_1806815 [Lactarius quietus]